MGRDLAYRVNYAESDESETEELDQTIDREKVEETVESQEIEDTIESEEVETSDSEEPLAYFHGFSISRRNPLLNWSETLTISSAKQRIKSLLELEPGDEGIDLDDIFEAVAVIAYLAKEIPEGGSVYYEYQ